MLRAGNPGHSHRSCFLCITQAIGSCSMLGTPCALDRRSMHARRSMWYHTSLTTRASALSRRAGPSPIRRSPTSQRQGPSDSPLQHAAAFCFSVLQTSPCSADNGIRAAPVLLMSRAYTPVLDSVVEPQSAAAGTADLPELPLQVRAVGALCFRRLLQLQWHCWWAQWQPLCLHLLAPRLSTFCPGSASCPRYCPSVAVRLCPHQEQLVMLLRRRC